jgi:hypothetical protein
MGHEPVAEMPPAISNHFLTANFAQLACTWSNMLVLEVTNTLIFSEIAVFC